MHDREMATGDQADEGFGILPKQGQWDDTIQHDRRNRTVTLTGQVADDIA